MTNDTRNQAVDRACVVEYGLEDDACPRKPYCRRRPAVQSGELLLQGTADTSRRLLAAPSVLAPESRVVIVGSEAHRRGTLSINSDRVAPGASNW